MTGRLRAISELAGRLNRLQDVDRDRQRDRRRGAVRSSTTTRSASTGSTTRPATCEPIAFQGIFLGGQRPGPGGPARRGRPRPDRLGRRPWRVGAAGRRLGRPADPGRPVDRGPGIDAPGADDLRRHASTASSSCPRRAATDSMPTTRRPWPIFAGYAAQALVNGANVERLRHQQRRTRTPARGPATPARGQREAAVDARAGGRPRPHRRFAQGDRAVRLADDLPGRTARQASGGPSWPATDSPTSILAHDDPARGRDHRLGHRQRRSRPGQRGASRPAVDPGPGHAVRARGDDRRPVDRRRRDDRHAQYRAERRGGGRVQRQRIRADPAVRRTGVDRPPERGDARGREGPGGPRRADRAAQSRRIPARARRQARRRRPRRAVRGDDAGPRRLQGIQRRLRPSGRRRVPGRRGRGARERDARRATCIYRYGGDEFVVVLPTARIADSPTRSSLRIRRGVADLSVGRAGHWSRSASASPAIPDDGRTKDALVVDGRPSALPGKAGGSLGARDPASTTRTSAPSTRPPSPCSTGTTRRSCSRRS